MVMIIMIVQKEGLPNNHACIVSDVISSLKQLLLGGFLHHFLSDFVLYLTQGNLTVVKYNSLTLQKLI